MKERDHKCVIKTTFLHLFGGQRDGSIYPQMLADDFRLPFLWSFSLPFVPSQKLLPWHLVANLPHPIQPRVPLSIQSHSISSNCLLFFWRGSLSKVARMSQYSWSLSSVSKTLGRPISHSSDFKCTLTFSFQPNTLPLPHCIASEPSTACCIASGIPQPVAWG